jgi:hypothetical protein
VGALGVPTQAVALLVLTLLAVTVEARGWVSAGPLLYPTPVNSHRTLQTVLHVVGWAC